MEYNTSWFSHPLCTKATKKFALDPAVSSTKSKDPTPSDMQFNQNLMPILKHTMLTDLVKHPVLYHYPHASHPAFNANKLPSFLRNSQQELLCTITCPQPCHEAADAQNQLSLL